MPTVLPRPTDPDNALRSLISDIAGQPQLLDDVLWRPLHGEFEIHPHAHARRLQLALLVDCGGRAFDDSRTLGLTGTSALTAYPERRHGFALTPLSASASVLVIKLRADRQADVARAEPFPAIATGLEPGTRLLEAAERLRREAPTHSDEPARWFAALVDILLHWPRQSTPGPARFAGGDGDPAVLAVLDLIEDRLDRPPSLTELAAAAHLSQRQFCRRFEAAMGRSAHEYLAARRLQRAKAMLFEPERSIADIAASVGFSGTPTFSRWFRQRAGRSPTQFRSDPAMY